MATPQQPPNDSWLQDSYNSSEDSIDYPIVNTDLLVNVPLDFIRDTFNHTDLPELFTNFEAALQGLEFSYEADAEKFDDESLQVEIGLLYGLLHARFVTTDQGLAKLRRMFLAGKFGVCPREGCKDCPLLPIGASNVPGVSPLGGYCVYCKDVYLPLSHDVSKGELVDGSFYGSSFPQVFLSRYPKLESKLIASLDATMSSDSPTYYKDIDTKLSRENMHLFGFKINWRLVE